MESRGVSPGQDLGRDGGRSQKTKLSGLLPLSGERCGLLGMLMKLSFVFVHQVSGTSMSMSGFPKSPSSERKA